MLQPVIIYFLFGIVFTDWQGPINHFIQYTVMLLPDDPELGLTGRRVDRGRGNQLEGAACIGALGVKDEVVGLGVSLTMGGGNVRGDPILVSEVHAYTQTPFVHLWTPLDPCTLSTSHLIDVHCWTLRSTGRHVCRHHIYSQSGHMCGPPLHVRRWIHLWTSCTLPLLDYSFLYIFTSSFVSSFVLSHHPSL